MTTPCTFAEHADLGFADADAVADYILRSGITAETDRVRLESMGIGPETWLLGFRCGPGILAVGAAW